MIEFLPQRPGEFEFRVLVVERGPPSLLGAAGEFQRLGIFFLPGEGEGEVVAASENFRVLTVEDALADGQDGPVFLLGLVELIRYTYTSVTLMNTQLIK